MNNPKPSPLPHWANLTILEDTPLWAVRLPDGEVPGRGRELNDALADYRRHLGAATDLGLREEFLGRATIVRCQRLEVRTPWELDETINAQLRLAVAESEADR